MVKPNAARGGKKNESESKQVHDGDLASDLASGDTTHGDGHGSSTALSLTDMQKLLAKTQARKPRNPPLRLPFTPLACLRASPKISDYPTKLRKQSAARKTRKLAAKLDFVESAPNSSRSLRVAARVESNRRALGRAGRRLAGVPDRPLITRSLSASQRNFTRIARGKGLRPTSLAFRRRCWFSKVSTDRGNNRKADLTEGGYGESPRISAVTHAQVQPVNTNINRYIKVQAFYHVFFNDYILYLHSCVIRAVLKRSFCISSCMPDL
ncbi:hypothetical protein EYF80_014135 [Liparis tanakae]|uniref:Uncharacterized protein n=1 Tax=Liparis tanakae TaxID=230148 RepID=A0A4Z2IDG3_9TELE|nr:hypothetical protein EYF80_014135 [Liparis tanakae]